MLKHAQPTDPLTYLHTTRSRYKHHPKKTGDGNTITNGHAITVLIVSTRATKSFAAGPKRKVDGCHLEKCRVIIGGMSATVCVLSTSFERGLMPGRRCAVPLDRLHDR
jgi:hypothetical protein